jgi:Ca2+-binding EF-hand superfamily protein
MQRTPLALAALLLLNACQSTPPAEESFEARFQRADSNQDGKLSRQEASDLYVRNVFESRDENQDGQLTATEWWPGNDAAQRAMFKQCDTNQDGLVSLAEALAWGRTNQGWGQVMMEADTNKDGFITLAEARAYLGSKEGPLR